VKETGDERAYDPHLQKRQLLLANTSFRHKDGLDDGQRREPVASL